MPYDRRTSAEAVRHFNEIITLAGTRGPQVVTRHGIPVAVVVSASEWNYVAKSLNTFTRAAARAQEGLIQQPAQGQA
jgi:prevent-host-death family protein